MRRYGGQCNECVSHQVDKESGYCDCREYEGAHDASHDGCSKFKTRDEARCESKFEGL